MCRVKAIGAEQKRSTLHRGIWCLHSLHSHFSYGRCPRSLPGRAGIIFNIAYEPAGAPRLLFRTQTTRAHGHAVQPARCSARGWNSWNNLKKSMDGRPRFLLSPACFLISSTMWLQLSAVLLWCSKTTPLASGISHGNVLPAQCDTWRHIVPNVAVCHGNESRAGTTISMDPHDQELVPALNTFDCRKDKIRTQLFM